MIWVIIPRPHVIKSVGFSHHSILADVFEGLRDCLKFVANDPEGRVAIFVDHGLGLIGQGDGTSDGVEMVAVKHTGRCDHGQQPGSVDIIAGDGIRCVGLGQEIPVCVIDVSGCRTIPNGLKAVAFAVVGELSGQRTADRL